mmetsp:Transcript_49222/g.96531  ORF Transcript_49222/g.96531 Transcript_49222/m.96531 type:complete len:261 (+) Transcript_49222:79-861(+)
MRKKKQNDDTTTKYLFGFLIFALCVLALGGGYEEIEELEKEAAPKVLSALPKVQPQVMPSLAIQQQAGMEEAAEEEAEDEAEEAQEKGALIAAHTAASECEWHGDENSLPGFCESMHPLPSTSTWQDCQKSCCGRTNCTGWQFRDDLGCRSWTKSGGGWCEPTAPAAWQGLHRVPHEMEDECEFDPKPQRSQCKGLGPKRKKGSASADACKADCCENAEECQLWQWREDKGCFWGKANYCDTDAGPYAFDAYKGQKKVTR